MDRQPDRQLDRKTSSQSDVGVLMLLVSCQKPCYTKEMQNSVQSISRRTGVLASGHTAVHEHGSFVLVNHDFGWDERRGVT